MSANAGTFGNVGAAENAGTLVGENKHPKGLYVLFGTELWERFSFYSMLALFTLYLRDPVEGFGWTAAQATTLYANYLMFVYASPLIGGLIADRITGYRKAVMIGGFFFMAGHGLLSIPALWAVYAALTCLVIGNGFFKPNVSTMVGNLYPEGSHLKDRAYNIFYMGINIGAFLAPIVMEIVKSYAGFHAAFAVAAFGMLISVGILWYFKNHVEQPDELANRKLNRETEKANTAATAVDAPPTGISDQERDENPPRSADQSRQDLMNTVPNWKRIMALIVIFAIVIVFWMVFHQNGSTLTYWADDNTAWNVSGTISNSINAFWVVTLTFPLIWFWSYLDKRGKEPATPTKMAIGMTLTGLSFLVLWYAATIGENQTPTAQQLATGEFRINERVVTNLGAQGVPKDVLDKIVAAKDADGKNLIYGVKFSPKADAATGQMVSGEQQLMTALNTVAPGQAAQYRDAFLQRAHLFRVSAFWLIFAYAVVTLGELMLSPMGLSLVSKVAPIHLRGLLMGGWFVATAIGNKLTQIGIFWDIWLQSTFFLVLAGMALVMAVVLFFLLKPLKRAMPGV
ncbi:MAG: Di-tripeptide/cation symporter [uncultured Pyrinomonadaceae bacterium]|uniref:Di-tripeptide/cation symporter n=1 Tax=uncultured Pyrinomonadaceae bacterium TaxID=2283094 RepID=A0A6J4N6C1_9BACT|nr:MAG: Di-tripeptide/cation symporter [uncultured Pyrinomonadaceae bacterium]